MSTPNTIPKRFIGLDVHKHYLIAIGVDADLNQIYGPKRVMLSHLDSWIQKTLDQEDALVIEMTTNTWRLTLTNEQGRGCITKTRQNFWLL